MSKNINSDNSILRNVDYPWRCFLQFSLATCKSNCRGQTNTCTNQTLTSKWFQFTLMLITVSLIRVIKTKWVSHEFRIWECSCQSWTCFSVQCIQQSIQYSGIPVPWAWHKHKTLQGGTAVEMRECSSSPVTKNNSLS